jgi:hypothetical protein
MYVPVLDKPPALLNASLAALGASALLSGLLALLVTA